MVKQAIRLTYQRDANEEDLQLADELLATLKAKHQLDLKTAWKMYCLVLLNTNEFLYLD